ncbi:uncharacterized protein LOC132205225 [Neocloeon triangulifer]|uniref:uncharacterized protein LOC132205225 n=1 Tax=Neocloeon triangulifer TaxID=2078957 RepID=UPI00286F096D|nr:uncharacterized protein LOC132205225 [Neocloeon triangulifer]
MEDDVGPLKIRPLPPDLLEHAIRKLHEDPKRRVADVQAIRDWLKKQRHIIGVPEDQLIINFLRGCKFSLERTKEKLDMYYTMKTMVPEFFKNRDLNSKENARCKEVLFRGSFLSLLEKDDEGRQVYLITVGKEEPGEMNMEEFMRLNYVIMDYIMMNDDALVVKGIVSIVDFSNLKFGHMTQMMPSVMKKSHICNEEGYPLRPQAGHILNMPSFMETLFKWMQSMHKEKVNRRTHVYGKNLERLYEQVPKRIMPKEYGGDAESTDVMAKIFAEKVLAFNDWIVADEKNGVDEKKRVGKSRTKEDLFGMEGSFRQLSIKVNAFHQHVNHVDDNMEDDVGTLKIRPLSPELLEYARKKLNEDPKRRAADVQAIRDWFKKQNHIIGDPSDQLIVSFLRGCKFSLERTKEKLDMYFTIKTLVPELFKNRDLTKNHALREIMNTGFFFPVGLDDEGNRVLVLVGGKDEPGKAKMEDIMKAHFMMLDYIMMHDDICMVKGNVNVMDMSQVKMGHVTQLMPSFLKKVSVCSAEGFPYRPQGLHFVRMPSMMDTIFRLIQTFTKEKINRRTSVHGKNLENLYEVVPKKVLPTEYGGDAGSVEELGKDFVEKMMEFNDWFVADEKNGVDEKKRIGNSKTAQDLLGMQGSFRQLSID